MTIISGGGPLLRILVDLPDRHLQELTELGRRSKQSRASLIREAVAAYLAARGQGSEMRSACGDREVGTAWPVRRKRARSGDEHPLDRRIHAGGSDVACGSPTCHAHMPRHRRPVVTAVDDEVVPLRL